MLGAGGLFVLLGVFVLAEQIASRRGISPRQGPILFAVLVGAMTSMGTYLIARAFYRLELSDGGFAIRSFGSRAYRCASFVGYRRFVTQGRYGRFTGYVLEGVPGQRDVTIALEPSAFSSEDRERLQGWVSRFPDLESADLDREE